MTSPTDRTRTLEGIRREIDGIDDAIADLLVRRMDASHRIKAEKSAAGSQSLPVRPAREAQILRRLVERSQGKVPTLLLARIWREILMSSTLAQAPLTVRIPAVIGSDPKSLSLVRNHFCNAPVGVHASETEVIAALAAQKGDMGVVSTDGGWVEPVLGETAGTVQVMGVLPAVGGPSKPELLMIGSCQAEPSGNDHTLLVSGTALPDAFARAAVWQSTSGGIWLTCLEGFIGMNDPAMIELSRHMGEMRVRIAGNYPAPIETYA